MAVVCFALMFRWAHFWLLLFFSLAQVGPVLAGERAPFTLTFTVFGLKALIYVLAAPETGGASLVFGAADLTLAFQDLVAKETGTESMGGGVWEAGAKLAGRALGATESGRDAAGVVGQFGEVVYGTYQLFKGNPQGSKAVLEKAHQTIASIDLLRGTSSTAEKYGKPPTGVIVSHGPPTQKQPSPPTKNI